MFVGSGYHNTVELANVRLPNKQFRSPRGWRRALLGFVKLELARPESRNLYGAYLALDLCFPITNHGAPCVPSTDRPMVFIS